jgi:TPR repeat protein
MSRGRRAKRDPIGRSLKNPRFASSIEWRSLAKYMLGMMYENGDGVPEDSARAAEWYRKAAEQDNAEAQSNLGVMYLLGEGVPKDAALAVQWFRRSAEQGNAAAQYNVGVMYYK